jgi:hypothetical protein
MGEGPVQISHGGSQGFKCIDVLGRFRVESLRSRGAHSATELSAP